MKNLLARFAKDESGATAIEYGLIAGLISIGILAAVTAAGDSIAGIFGAVRDALAGVTVDTGS